MEALVCEICGGKLVMGSGGIAVCDSCGLEYSKERIKEKIQEIKGVVQIDNSNQLENWIRMGDNAMKAKNYSEAYSYYTKVIETDPFNWEATIKRGESAFWQGTLSNPRLNEVVAAMERALEIVDRSQMDNTASVKAKVTITQKAYWIHINYSATLQMHNLTQKFETLSNSYAYIDTSVYGMLSDVYRSCYDFANRFIKMFEKSEIEEAKSWVESLKDFRVTFLCDYCSYDNDNKGVFYGPSLNEKKAMLEDYLPWLDELLEIKPDYLSKESVKYPYPYDRPLNMSEFERRTKDLPNYWKRKYESFQMKKKEKEKERRQEEYWSQHFEQKQALESQLSMIGEEKKSVLKTLAVFDGQIKKAKKETEEKVTEVEKELIALKSEMGSLEAQRNNLGLFSGKQKKELQAKIDMLKEQLSIVEDRAKSSKAEIEAELKATLNQLVAECKPYTDKLNQLNEEELQINIELKKDR